MKKVFWVFAGVLLTQTACDLQPKITNLPDSVGDFISARYPTLLADPNEYPEIYNSAASDYGVYAAPQLYGTEIPEDYVMYASVDDYIVPPQMSEYGSEPQVEPGAEFVAKASEEATDDFLVVPMYGGTEKLAEDQDVSHDVLEIARPQTGVQTVTRVDLTDIRVESGDTLYSLSRKYSIPVNDLAVMNNLRAPFSLSVGQKLRVPNLADVRVADKKAVDAVEDVKKSQKASVKKEMQVAQSGKTVPVKTEAKETQLVNKEQKKTVVAEKKISSDPSKKLPKITARSSSKFSWPVRGKVLSAYGAKSNGLFNDGINIAATRGTTVSAAENGVVAYAGNEVKGMGNLVIIQHDGGWMTVYAHMDSMAVRRGTRVRVGQKIGAVGQTGKVDAPQLHFEIRKGTKAYNPTSYLKK